MDEVLDTLRRCPLSEYQKFLCKLWETDSNHLLILMECHDDLRSQKKNWWEDFNSKSWRGFQEECRCYDLRTFHRYRDLPRLNNHLPHEQLRLPVCAWQPRSSALFLTTQRVVRCLRIYVPVCYQFFQWHVFSLLYFLIQSKTVYKKFASFHIFQHHFTNA